MPAAPLFTMAPIYLKELKYKHAPSLNPNRLRGQANCISVHIGEKGAQCSSSIASASSTNFVSTLSTRWKSASFGLLNFTRSEWLRFRGCVLTWLKVHSSPSVAESRSTRISFGSPSIFHCPSASYHSVSTLSNKRYREPPLPVLVRRISPSRKNI